MQHFANIKMQEPPRQWRESRRAQRASESNYANVEVFSINYKVTQRKNV